MKAGLQKNPRFSGSEIDEKNPRFSESRIDETNQVSVEAGLKLVGPYCTPQWPNDCLQNLRDIALYTCIIIVYT